MFEYKYNKNTSRSYNYVDISPYIVIRVSYFLFIKSITFEEVSKEYLDFYNESINRKTTSK